jgi:beta-glucosidase
VPTDPATLVWPAGFLWGVSTSSYQIEGAVGEDGRGPSIWDVRCRTQGKIAHGHTGDVACDHYHRYAEDVDLIRALGVDAYRFSIAWPRVLPRGRGAVSEAGLAFYDRLIDALLAAGVEPWVCLYHWDLPQALDDLGGWTHRDSVGWFADYAAVVARRYGDRVKRWATLNELAVFTLFGYAHDWGAPGVTDRAAHLRAIHHVNLAHGAGVDVLRALVPEASVGVIHNRQPIWPEHETPADRAVAALLDEHWNHAFPDPQCLGHYPPQVAAAIEPYVQAGDLARICRPIDWFGLNHYGPIFAKADPGTTWGFGWGSPPADAPRSEIGWPIYPGAFRDVLVELARAYRLPIYVTENGAGGHDVPDAAGRVDDPKRITFLQAYVGAMHEAIAAGADVRGYFVWSLLDSFEWGAGYGEGFGIVHVDRETLARTPKSSFRWYAALIRAAREKSAARGRPG